MLLQKWWRGTEKEMCARLCVCDRSLGASQQSPQTFYYLVTAPFRMTKFIFIVLLLKEIPSPLKVNEIALLLTSVAHGSCRLPWQLTLCWFMLQIIRSKDGIAHRCKHKQTLAQTHYPEVFPFYISQFDCLDPHPSLSCRLETWLSLQTLSQHVCYLLTSSITSIRMPHRFVGRSGSKNLFFFHSPSSGCLRRTNYDWRLPSPGSPFQSVKLIQPNGFHQLEWKGNDVSDTWGLQMPPSLFFSSISPAAVI